MSLSQTSSDDLNAMILALTGVSLAGVYSVLAIRPTTESDGVANNTKIRLQALSGNATYQGTQDLFYDRLDFSDLANFSPYQVIMTSGVSILTQLDVILRQYGINLTAADIADATTTTVGSTVQVVLTALEDSLGWTGSTTLNFAPLPNISTAFFSNILTGF